MKRPVTFTHDALGTRFYIEICDEVTPIKLAEIINETGLILNQFEARYSRFLPNSLVSTLNRERFLSHAASEFISLLEYGQDLTKRTDGLFNMLLGKTLSARGYDSNYSFVPSIPKLENFAVPNPLTDLKIDSSTIYLANGNLDLGGFGKGYVIDLLSAHLTTTYNLKYFLINGGGDIYATSNYGAPFTIYLEHPLKAQTYLGTTEILNQGFAASSPHKRSWVHNGTTYNHIIDTTPAYTDSKLCDASFIIAHNCVEADAFATIALLVSEKELSDLAKENQLAYTTFSVPNLRNTNAAFVVQNL